MRACRTGLAERATVLRLSHQITGGLWIGILSSVRRDFNHTISAVAAAKLRYSASVEERDTVGCFFDNYVTRLFPRKTQIPLVDLLLSVSVAQSASEKPVRCKFGERVKCKP